MKYLSSQDQHPVHTVLRQALLRPVHKEHRPVPALRMNPLTTMMLTEKENLAQQYKVHEVMTREDPDVYVLINDEHWTLTPEAHKYAGAARSFYLSLRKTENNKIHTT